MRPRRYSSLSACERFQLGRRLRLEWACNGDLEHVQRVERAIATSEAMGPRRPTCSPPAPRMLEPE